MPELLQLAHGVLGFLPQSGEPLGVVKQDGACLGQSPALRRPVEEAFAQLPFKPADCLADGRLGAVETRGGPREAVFGRHHLEDFKFAEFHNLLTITNIY